MRGAVSNPVYLFFTFSVIRGACFLPKSIVNSVIVSRSQVDWRHQRSSRSGAQNDARAALILKVEISENFWSPGLRFTKLSYNSFLNQKNCSSQNKLVEFKTWRISLLIFAHFSAYLAYKLRRNNSYWACFGLARRKQYLIQCSKWCWISTL